MAKFPMTPRGQQSLREELKHLRKVERPKNVQDIEEARAHGNLRENAEYHAAKEKQGFIEGRSREIEAVLAQAEVIDPARLSGKRVVFGAKVQLTDTDSGEETTYTIVGDYESDIKLGRIAIRSWIGMVEAASVEWAASKNAPREELRDLLVDMLFELLTRVLQTKVSQTEFMKK